MHLVIRDLSKTYPNGTKALKRVHSGRQTITVLVNERPSRAGIGPHNLLDWEEGDNIEGVVMGGGG